MDFTPLAATDFRNPSILLTGPVDNIMYSNFRQQILNAPAEGIVTIEMSTLGGDPEVARVMGEDVRFLSDMDAGRRFVFLGKAAIYSAGTTFMSFFARQNRYLTRGTRLMIHERIMMKQLTLNGPLTACLASVRAALHELEASIEIQNEGFRHLLLGSQVTMEEILSKAPSNWYIEANEAASLGLIESVI